MDGRSWTYRRQGGRRRPPTGTGTLPEPPLARRGPGGWETRSGERGGRERRGTLGPRQTRSRSKRGTHLEDVHEVLPTVGGDGHMVPDPTWDVDTGRTVIGMGHGTTHTSPLSVGPQEPPSRRSREWGLWGSTADTGESLIGFGPVSSPPLSPSVYPRRWSGKEWCPTPAKGGCPRVRTPEGGRRVRGLP